MKIDMKAWLDSVRSARDKKPLPILSFPAVSLLSVSVRELVSDSTLQAEGMRLVKERCDPLASVSFMDLSVEAEAFGAEIVFSKDEVPTVRGRLVNDSDEADALAVPTVGAARTGVYVEAIEKAVGLITDRPVLAGMIGPFSLAARLLDVSAIMMDCYDDPDMVHTVLRKTTDFLIEYARAFKAAGANGVIMAEPVSGLLSPSLEAEFSAPYVKEIADALQDDSFIVVYHNCGNNVPLMLKSIFSTGCAAYHFGNSVDIKSDVIDQLPVDGIVMGNVDPVGVLWLGTPELVRETTLALLEKCSGYHGFVLSSGCDIPPMTPWENIDAFFSANEEFHNA